MNARRVRPLLTLAGASSAVFALVATASGTRASAHLDRKLEPRIAFRPRSRARRLADAASPAGKWYTLATATTLIGTWLATQHGRRVGGAIIATSGIAGAGLTLAFDRVMPQPPVSTGHRDEPNKPTFPSGHAFMSTVTSLTTAYVFTREGFLPPRVAVPLAAMLPIANTTLKLGARKHWASDAAGGVVGGVAVAALCCAAYETLSDR
jgi:hypothetical protein